MIKVCVVCGTTYETKCPHQRSCGSDCRRELHRQSNKRNRNSPSGLARVSKSNRQFRQSEFGRQWIDRYRRSSYAKALQRSYKKKNYQKNPDKFLLRSAKWREKNPEEYKLTCRKSNRKKAIKRLEVAVFGAIVNLAEKGKL